LRIDDLRRQRGCLRHRQGCQARAVLGRASGTRRGRPEGVRRRGCRLRRSCRPGHGNIARRARRQRDRRRETPFASTLGAGSGRGTRAAISTDGPRAQAPAPREQAPRGRQGQAPWELPSQVARVHRLAPPERCSARLPGPDALPRARQQPRLGSIVPGSRRHLPPGTWPGQTPGPVG
jgi:hypothetical protein